MAGSVFTFVGSTNPKNRTTVIDASQGDIAIGQSGLLLPSELQAAQAQGLNLAPGPAVSPASQLNAPTLAGTISGSLTGAYKYVVTFVTAAGETTASAETSITVSAKEVSLSNLPLGNAQSGVIARKLYRTSAGGSSGTEKLAATISDNTTTTAVDNLVDGSLGTVVPTIDTAGVISAGGSMAAQTIFAELTGNPSDDTFAISAGTGQKLAGGGGSGVQVAGDIGGTTSSPLVVGLQGKAISGTAPSSNQALVWNGTAWAPTTLSSGGTLAGDTDVLLTSPANNQGLVFNSGAGKWENATLTASLVGALPSTDDLSAIAFVNPTAASVAMNAKKITGLANGTASSDGAAFGQIPTALPPNGSAGGDLSGTYPNPEVAKVTGIAISGTPTSGQILTATSGTAADWQNAPSGSTPSPSGPSGTAGGNTGSAVTIGAPTTFNQWWGVMNAATVTVTLPTPVAGALFQARLDQDATGGRTLAFAVNPTFPTHTSAASAIAAINAFDAANAEIWITFICVDGTTWQAFPTLPSKRSVVSIASGATITPAVVGPQDFVFTVSALAAAMTVNAPTGVPVDGQKVEFRLSQNGTGGFAITWNSVFNRANTALVTWPAEPTTASVTWRELYEWNAGTSKWDLVAMV